MRSMLVFVLLAAVSPLAAEAQSMDQKIANALLAAPARLQAEAAVIEFDSNGEIVVVREGTNGLMCWDSSNEPGQQGNFSAQCTSELNRARVQQNHQLSHQGGTPEGINELMDEAEANGTREVPAYGTMYYHWMGGPSDGRSHTNIAVPFATEASSGIPEGRRNDAMWIMDAGTSGAHLMIPGL